MARLTPRRAQPDPRAVTPWWRVMPYPHLMRAYRAMDCLTLPVSWQGFIPGPGHLEGGYCLDAPDPADVHGPVRPFVSVHVAGGGSVRRPCDYTERPADPR